jgi:subtilisin-like proprotein convertase family protein
MKKKLLLLILVLFYTYTNAQNKLLWTRINNTQNSIEKKSKNNTLQFKLDADLLKEILTTVPNNTSKNQETEISIPNRKGELEKFIIQEYSNFSVELQELYPNIRSYAGTGKSDPTASVHFSISENKIQTMILRGNSGSEFIEVDTNDKTIYTLHYAENRETGNLPFSCSTNDTKLNTELLDKTNKTKASDKIFKTFRLALSCNGEYSDHFGNTIEGVLGGMNATMTRVNGIFNKDLAVKFEIIANTTKIIYLDASTDPYSDASLGAENPSGAKWNIELQENLTSVIKNTGYDVGHLFAGSGGGGNAGCIGCICVNPTTNTPRGKGSAYSAPGNGAPIGDFFDIDIVAHEMGHQLGGNHTFSFKIEGTGANIEPGSGTTIMGYAGVTNYNVQSHSDDYYSVNSITQIQNNLSSKTCSIDKIIPNNPPIISAGLDYTIPKGTPFILIGTGVDPDGDNVTFCWEQNDTAITQIDANSIAFPTKIDGPLFRSLNPSNSPIRYMPALKDVLTNTLTTKWESVSNIGRVLNFSLTARDNAIPGTAQTKTDNMVVTVSETAGPFELTSQNTTDIGWLQNSTQTITWNANGSETLDGASMLNIKLSTDGGLTFPIILASNTPNDGSEMITVPTITATNCRLLIEPTNNVFYAVNTKAFAIGYSVTSACDTYNFNAPFPIVEGNNYTIKTINVPNGSTTVAKINIALGVTHPFMSDIEVDLVSPQGTIVKLLNKSCGDSNVKLNFDDLGNAIACSSTSPQTVIPAQPLSVFNGQNPENTWSLRFRDTSNGDTGTIDFAELTICTQTFTTLSNLNYTINDFILYPNPNKGNFNIQFNSKSSDDIAVTVFDVLGRKVFDKKYSNKANFNETIQLKNVKSGIYILSVLDGERREEKKIVIE